MILSARLTEEYVCHLAANNLTSEHVQEQIIRYPFGLEQALVGQPIGHCELLQDRSLEIVRSKTAISPAVDLKYEREEDGQYRSAP